MVHSADPPGRAAVGAALRVGGLLSCLFLLCLSTTFRLDDEHILAARTQSLALTGGFSEPQVYGNERVQSLLPMGDPATQVEPLHTLLTAPLYRAAVAADAGGVQAAFLLNLYLTAICGAMLTLAVIRLGFPEGTGVWCGMLFGAGTMAWVYATSLLRDPVAMTGVSLSLLGLATLLGQPGSHKASAAALIPLGLLLGVLAKNTVLAYGLGGLLAAAVLLSRPLRSGRINRRHLLGAALVLVAVAALWSRVPPTGPLARFSPSYYASLLVHFTGGLGGDLLAAALGPFVSPAKSIFLFSPPLLLGLVGVWRSDRRLAWPILAGTVALATAQGLFYRGSWAGSIGWGLRWMLPAIPGLILLAAPVVDRLRTRPAGTFLLALSLAGSALIQVAGCVVDWGPVYAGWRALGLNVASSGAAWEPQLLAIPGQLANLADPDTWLPVWWRLRQAPGVAGTSILIALVGLSLGALILLPRARADRGIWRVIGSMLTVLCFVLPAFPTLWLVRGDPRYGGDRPEFAEALTAWEQGGEADDLVVVDSYGTSLWRYFLNRWRSPVAWYSLAYDIPGSQASETLPPGGLSESTVALLSNRVTGRLWYFGSSEAPDYGTRRKPDWLDSQYALIGRRAFVGASEVDLRIYAAGDP